MTINSLRRSAVIAILGLLGLSGVTPAVAAEFELSDYTGSVVVVDFWASWCVPCRRSFPWLNAMHDKYGEDGLIIIGVNLDQDRAEAEQFLTEFPPKFRVVYDETKQLAEQFDVIAMPTSYLIGRDGQQIRRHFGFKVKKQDEYESAIVEALGTRE